MTNQETARELLYTKWDKLYLNKEETASELGVARATIDRMRQTGEIKSSTIRGSVKFSIAEIVKFTPN